jgi:hypothetical protein
VKANRYQRQGRDHGNVDFLIYFNQRHSEPRAGFASGRSMVDCQSGSAATRRLAAVRHAR